MIGYQPHHLHDWQGEEKDILEAARERCDEAAAKEAESVEPEAAAKCFDEHAQARGRLWLTERLCDGCPFEDTRP